MKCWSVRQTPAETPLDSRVWLLRSPHRTLGRLPCALHPVRIMSQIRCLINYLESWRSTTAPAKGDFYSSHSRVPGSGWEAWCKLTSMRVKGQKVRGQRCGCGLQTPHCTEPLGLSSCPKIRVQGLFMAPKVVTVPALSPQACCGLPGAQSYPGAPGSQQGAPGRWTAGLISSAVRSEDLAA